MKTQLSQEVESNAIKATAFAAFDAMALKNELEEHRPYLRAKLATVFQEAYLPATIRSKKKLSNEIRNPVELAFRKITKYKEIDEAALQEIQTAICIEVNFLFYRDYIASTLSQKLIPYCQTHPAPKQWGLGAVVQWDAKWGSTFYSFWRKHIEKKSDEKFRQKILPFLPQEWQQSYQMKKEAKKCPYDWENMTNDDIAKTLMNLKKRADPATEQWWMGSIRQWTDPESGNLWGKSFMKWWRNHIEQEGDEQFRKRILPKFPESWQKNFKRVAKCPFRWREMDDQSIAAALSTLVSPHGFKRWGLGALPYWYDPSTRKKYGDSFYKFWRRNNKNAAEKEFRQRILPLLPPRLRDSYRPVGYVIPFHPETPEDHAQADALYDWDLLHCEAHKGNRAAFERLKNLINVDYPEALIERIIHTHLPVFGTLEKYARSCARKFSRRFTSTQPDETSGPQKHGMPKGSEEDLMIDKIDAQRILEGMNPDAIDELLDI